MKKFDLVVGAGKTKQGKTIWKTIGAMMTGDKGDYLLLDKTFNPAGIQGAEQSVFVNLFEPKEKQSNAQALGFDNEDPFK
ncbi:MAG: hypothetical protein H0X02_06695 [Nitrosomonas sp.]|nr:hypothetical protein [Nitrosomonas sp.]